MLIVCSVLIRVKLCDKGYAVLIVCSVLVRVTLCDKGSDVLISAVFLL